MCQLTMVNTGCSRIFRNRRAEVKDFDTKEEACEFAIDMQRAIDKGAVGKNDNEISD